MSTFNVNYYTDEIAESLCRIAGVKDNNVYAEVEEALYNLKVICENDLNKEKYRTLYRLLEEVAKAVDGGLLKR